MSSSPYHAQVSLLLRVLPMVGREAAFALKGGTAINLFVRNLPRLSVDIDLTFLPLMERNEALAAIRDALQRIADDIKRQIRGATVNTSPRIDAPKLVVSASGAVIKVEPTRPWRGSVYLPGVRRTSPAVEAEFEQSISISVVSEADLCRCKLVAALDRQQHPSISLTPSCYLTPKASPTRSEPPSSSTSPVTHGLSRRSWIRG